MQRLHLVQLVDLLHLLVLLQHLHLVQRHGVHLTPGRHHLMARQHGRCRRHCWIHAHYGVLWQGLCGLMDGCRWHNDGLGGFEREGSRRSSWSRNRSRSWSCGSTLRGRGRFGLLCLLIDWWLCYGLRILAGVSSLLLLRRWVLPATSFTEHISLSIFSRSSRSTKPSMLLTFSVWAP